MKTVWVIEQGSYSDYRVVGIFTNKKDAETVCGVINASDPYDAATVSEWPLDPGIKELNAGLPQWTVHMLIDGSTERCEKREFSAYDIAGSHFLWKRTQAPAYRGTNTPDCLTATVWAKDEKHAVKIVNEIRTQMIANGEWK